MSKCIPKQTRPQLLPETVGTERRVSEAVRQRTAGCRTGDGERPTAERAAARQDGGGRKIEVADDRQRPTRGGSSPRGTREPRPGDTGEPSPRAHGGPAAEHRASAARSGADVPSPGRTSQHHRRHGPRHPANAATRQRWPPATRPTRYFNRQYAM